MNAVTQHNNTTEPKYNRLELVMIGANEYKDFMEFQPYKNKGLYIVSPTDFILYDKPSGL